MRRVDKRRQLIDLSDYIPKVPEHQARNLGSAIYQQKQVAEIRRLPLVHSSITSLSFAGFIYIYILGKKAID